MIGKAIAEIIGNIISEVGTTADKFITTGDEKSQFKQQLSDIVLKYSTQLANIQADVLKGEVAGNWLQRSWRPIIMLAFGFIIFYRYFLSQVFGLPAIEMPNDFWSLLEIGMGGYVIGRSVEKISDRVTKNIDINRIKRKDRKDIYKS